MACHCNDCSRARPRAAGLRGIEPGMPTQAGTGLNRRSFLARGSGLALSVFGGSLLSQMAFKEGIARAQSGLAVLVWVFLSGGLDSLSLLPPVGELPLRTAAQPRARRERQLRRRVHRGLAAALAPERGAAARPAPRGKVSVMPAIGYSNPNQSHFTSRHYWEVGEVNPFGRIGWLGRYLDQHGTTEATPLPGLHRLEPGRRWPPRTCRWRRSRTRDLNLGARDVWDGTLRTKLVEARAAHQGTLATNNASCASARNAARQTVSLRGQLAGLQGTDAP